MLAITYLLKETLSYSPRKWHAAVYRNLINIYDFINDISLTLH